MKKYDSIVTQKYYDGKWHDEILSAPKETAIIVYINGEELVTISCSPFKMNFLVLGYLYNEGIINEIGDISALGVCEDNAIASVRLKKNSFTVPKKKIITSGCGGGIIFNDEFCEKIDSELTIEPNNLFHLMRSMLKNAEHYKESGGIHASAICDSENIIAMSEDIGRHNTIDKIVGECIFNNISTKDKILITTGRISSEMLRKAVKLKVPIVASLSSPTDIAIKLAKDFNVTLIGYVRSNKMTLYSYPERLKNNSYSDSQLTKVAVENFVYQDES